MEHILYQDLVVGKYVGPFLSVAAPILYIYGEVNIFKSTCTSGQGGMQGSCTRIYFIYINL